MFHIELVAFVIVNSVEFAAVSHGVGGFVGLLVAARNVGAKVGGVVGRCVVGFLDGSGVASTPMSGQKSAQVHPVAGTGARGT